MFLDCFHRPVFILKHNVSETGFCLRLQVEPTQLGPIDRISPYLLFVTCTNTRFISIYIKERKYNLTQGPLEKSKLVQHTEEGRKIC
jgi:hypothetical protein